MTETHTTVTAPRFFFVKDAPARTGYSQKAVRKKIETGVWLDGHEYRRAPGAWLDAADAKAMIEWERANEN